MNIKKQLRILNAFGFSACLRIPDAVWVVLLVARGYSLWQVGLAEGIFHIVSILGEIPSGMAADLIGRRRSLMAAGLCGVISALLMAFSQSFFGVCLSMVFSALACNFISGSEEALLYDSLLQVEQQDSYLSVNARYAQMQNLGSLLSNAASLLSGIFSYVGFYLTDAAVCIVRYFTARALTEPTVTKAQVQRQAHPFRNLPTRFREHVQEVTNFLRTYPKAVFLMLADGLLTLPSFLTLMFLQQRLTELGMSTLWLGLPIMAISLARISGVALGKRLHPRRLRNLYIVCAILIGVGTVTAGTAPILPAILGAMVASGSIDLWLLHLQKHLNRMFPSDRRATLVSVNMMAYSLLMIFASPLAGWLGDITHAAGTGLCVLGFAVFLAGVAASFTRHK